MTNGNAVPSMPRQGAARSSLGTGTFPFALAPPDPPRDRVAPNFELRLGDATNHAPHEPPATALRLRLPSQPHDELGERRLREPLKP